MAGGEPGGEDGPQDPPLVARQLARVVERQRPRAVDAGLVETSGYQGDARPLGGSGQGMQVLQLGHAVKPAPDSVPLLPSSQ